MLQSESGAQWTSANYCSIYYLIVLVDVVDIFDCINMITCVWSKIVDDECVSSHEFCGKQISHEYGPIFMEIAKCK